MVKLSWTVANAHIYTNFLKCKLKAFDGLNQLFDQLYIYIEGNSFFGDLIPWSISLRSFSISFLTSSVAECTILHE